MENKKRPISQILFHVFVGLLTSLIFGVAGLVILRLVGIIHFGPYLFIFGFLMIGRLFMFIIAGAIARRVDRKTTLWITGFSSGRYIAGLIGGLAGGKLGGSIGAFAGFLILYLVGRKLGPLVNTGIAVQLEKYFIQEWQTDKTLPKPNLKLRKWAGAYFILLPPFFATIVFMFEYYDITISSERSTLILFRIALWIFSVWSIGGGWLLGRIHPAKFGTVGTDTSGFSRHFVRLTLMATPSIFGLIIYVMGGTVWESLALIFLSFVSVVLFLIKVSRKTIP